MKFAPTVHFESKTGQIALLAVALACATIPAGAADCIVNAHSTAKLGAATKGIISEVRARRGDSVAAGEVLAKLESSEEKSRLALASMRAEDTTPIEAAHVRAKAAEARAKRVTFLRERDATTQSELEKAVLEAESARLDEGKAKLEQAIAREEAKAAVATLERKTVRAPFDGVVTSRLMSKGELYNEQAPIIVVARIDPLHVETFLPASELPRVSLDEIVPVQLENGKVVEGRVKVIDPILDAATGTFGVRLEVPNPKGAILAGQRCTVSFDQ